MSLRETRTASRRKPSLWRRLAFWRSGPALLGQLAQTWRDGLIGGLGTMSSYGIALWAMTLAPVAMVAALRETSILFATGISALVLGENVGLPLRELDVGRRDDDDRHVLLAIAQHRAPVATELDVVRHARELPTESTPLRT